MAKTEGRSNPAKTNSQKKKKMPAFIVGILVLGQLSLTGARQCHR
jgi:hypothetical protein